MPDADTPRESDSAEQKRFIRTFAGDVAAVQSGETPDLKPLDSVAPPAPSPVFTIPPEQPAATVPPAQEQVPPPAISQSAPPEMRGEEDKEVVLARLRAKVAASAPLQATPPPPEPAPLLAPEQPTSSPIHTYASDFSDNVKNKRASTASILAAEQDAGPVPTGPAPEKGMLSGILFAVSGLALVALGGAGAYVAYQTYQGQSLPVSIIPTVSAPIFVDERAEVSGTSTALLQAVEQSAATPLESDGIRFLYTVTSTSTDQSVFSALQLPAPGLLLRNIDAQGSMAGIVQLHGIPSVFFILAVQSYSDTFAGMLSWEQTMPRDLAPLFPPYPSPTMSLTMSTSTATSTATSTVSAAEVATSTFSLVYKPGFFDEVVASHDARSYRDSSGKTLFIYSYANPNTLILARDAEALVEILSRISTSRSK